MPPSSPPQTLLSLPLGGRGRVVRIRGAGPVSSRLAALGFRPGAPVALVRKAPLGGPWVFQVAGAQICLRPGEVSTIEMVRLGAES